MIKSVTTQFIKRAREKDHDDGWNLENHLPSFQPPVALVRNNQWSLFAGDHFRKLQQAILQKSVDHVQTISTVHIYNTTHVPKVHGTFRKGGRKSVIARGWGRQWENVPPRNYRRATTNILNTMAA